MTAITTVEQLGQVVRESVTRQTATDMHTHLYAPQYGKLLLRGIDELLTYHYLIAETMRWHENGAAEFWKLGKREQADLVWRKLFIEHSPVSEACRGVLTTLKRFGLNPGSRDLESYRRVYAGIDPFRHTDMVLNLANVDHAVMTNDPFDDEERPFWLAGVTPDPRFHAALRIDPLVNRYDAVAGRLREWGYDVGNEWSERTAGEVRRFLADWLGRMKPLYMAVSLPDDFVYPDDTVRTRVIQDCILPLSREANVPLAMMIGVRRQVNPALRSGGDAVGKADLESVSRLVAANPANKFLVTALARENQHELVVLARKFGNLMIFGCWWFLNNPSLVSEMTKMRVEMLGTSFIPQHSDARVLDQLIYKWDHSRAVIADVLIEKYRGIFETGWRIDAAEIRRDVADLMRNNFWRFVNRPDMVRYD